MMRTLKLYCTKATARYLKSNDSHKLRESGQPPFFVKYSFMLDLSRSFLEHFPRTNAQELK